MSVKHSIRAKDGGYVDVELSRSRAIKAMCTECCGHGEYHPRDCTDPHCPLWPFRGKINLAYRQSDETEDADETDNDED